MNKADIWNMATKIASEIFSDLDFIHGFQGNNQ